MKVKGEVPDDFFIWFEEIYKKSIGKEKEMLSRVDIWECEDE